ncbi:hypothetical protein [Patulibacter sp.]|uniref:hypothetical protein n=1 Tax=Patulibacter sp. TaxID=1912859 RepID=UPI0027242D0E|nr:hypothetical protein [Patulibacter sp.]MDO9408074.1 hypothetical protein [Patulibacter sp.]
MTTTPKTRRLRVAGITTIAAASLAIGGVVSQTAGAADSTGSGTTTSSSRPATPPKPPSPGQEDARLAKALGVSQDKVESARKAVRAAELDAAVKAGKVTSKQQDLIEQLRETGFDVPLPPGAGGGPGSGTDPDTALAKELGVSVSKLRDARPAPPAGGPGKDGKAPTPPGGTNGKAPTPPAGGPSKDGKAPTPPAGAPGKDGKAPTPPAGAPTPGSGTGTTGTAPTPPSTSKK